MYKSIILQHFVVIILFKKSLFVSKIRNLNVDTFSFFLIEMLSVLTALILALTVSLIILLLALAGLVKLNKIQFKKYELVDSQDKFNYFNLNGKLKRKFKILKNLRGIKHTQANDKEDVQNLIQSANEIDTHEIRNLDDEVGNFSDSSNMYDRMLSDFVRSDPTSNRTSGNTHNSRPSKKSEAETNFIVSNEKKTQIVVNKSNQSS